MERNGEIQPYPWEKMSDGSDSTAPDGSGEEPGTPQPELELNVEPEPVQITPELLDKYMKLWRETSLDQFIRPETMRVIGEASGGFSFHPDPKLAMEAMTTGTIRTGYTILADRRIYFNPLLVTGMPELKIEPWKPFQARGFSWHETGHHTPAVVMYQDIVSKRLGDRNIIPEGYRGVEELEARFFQALHSHLHNTIFDIWLESYMSREPYLTIRKDIREFQVAKGEMQDLRQLTKPEQFCQALLASRYREAPVIVDSIGIRPLTRTVLERHSVVKGNVDQDVFDAYCKTIIEGGMRTLINRSAHESYFASLTQRVKEIEQKVTAYNAILLPEYLRLLQAELEERKQERQRQKAEGEPGRQAEPGEGSPGGRDAVPLTKEEIEELIQEILEQIDKAGQEMASQAPSQEEEAKIRAQFQQIRQQLHAQHQAMKQGKGAPPQFMPEPQEIDPEEMRRRLTRELQRKQREANRKGTAERAGVSPEAVRKWEYYKERYKDEIESTASVLSSIFLDDRRHRIEYGLRHGEITPGLEYETISAMVSGGTDPDTLMDVVRNTEFLETELEGIIDRSGSMSGEKLEQSTALFVIIVEAFKKVRENLAAEDLIAPLDDQPFRVGVTAFETEPDRITKLDEPLTDQKEMKIIDKLSNAGGGTEEVGAITEVYSEMKLRKGNVIKFIVVLTDGQGSKEAATPIMRQIEEDDEVIFLVVGLGDDAASAQAITETYIAPLHDREKNVFAIAAETPKQVLPQVLEFLKREVEKRRSNF